MAVSEGEGNGKGGVFDATVFVFDAVRSIKSTTVLSFLEKKWICYQLLHAMKFTHERNVTHGDVKCENVLITSTRLGVFVGFCEFQTKVGAGG